MCRKADKIMHFEQQHQQQTQCMSLGKSSQIRHCMRPYMQMPEQAGYAAGNGPVPTFWSLCMGSLRE